jgi:prevent-host-death family protein
MPLDFDVLSMTELRTRPGDILDRASEGKAFIIESNGRRKACLVPITLFFPDVSPARIAEEIEQLENQGEELRTTFMDSRELGFRFKQLLNDNTEVELTILLPHGYPNSCPRVTASPLEDKTPHRWADGSLCLYGVMGAWNPGRDSVVTTLSLVRRWLQRYDAWRQVGRWPQEEEMSNG